MLVVELAYGCDGMGGTGQVGIGFCGGKTRPARLLRSISDVLELMLKLVDVVECGGVIISWCIRLRSTSMEILLESACAIVISSILVFADKGS